VTSGHGGRRDDLGSVGVVLIAVLAAVTLVVMSALTAAASRVSTARARGAADAAAIAAAGAAVGLLPDAPCAAARRLARANRAAVTSCDLQGATAVVAVVVGSGLLSARATATAGPRTTAGSAPGRSATVRAVQPGRAGSVRLHRASPPKCVWCACRPAGHRIPGRPGRIQTVRRPISTIDQGDTCQARRSS
jgi:secretion/DNA translocation related TadE-like protein